MPQYKLANIKPPAGMKTHPIPLKVKGRTVNLNFSPAGKKYLANRAAGKPTNVTPATAYRLGMGGRVAGGGRQQIARTPEEMLMSVITDYRNSIMTPAQQMAMYQKGINTQVAAQTAATRAAVQEQIRAAKAATASEQYAARQAANRAQGFALALGSLTKGEGEQAYSDYERAAQNIQGLGTGLTGAVQATQQASADQAAADLAQASGGINTAGTSYDLAGLRNIAQLTGVVNPSRDLYEEAANQAAGARVRNAAAAQHVSNIAEDFSQKALTAQNTLTGTLGTLRGSLADKLQAIQATRPDLYQKAVEATQSGNRQDMATLISALTLANTQAQTAAQIAGTNVETAGAQAEQTGFQYNADGTIKVGKNGQPLMAPGYYLPNWSNGVPQQVPDGYKPNKAGTGLVALPKATAPGEDPKSQANWDAGYTRDGKDVRDGFYWGPGHKPRKIPQGWMLKPNDPTKTKIVRNPQQGGGGGGAGGAAWTPKRIADTIGQVNDELPSIDAPGAYSRITNPALVKAGMAPVFKPTMTLKKAIARLRSKYPKAIQNNPAVTTAITDALATIGYKV